MDPIAIEKIQRDLIAAAEQEVKTRAAQARFPLELDLETAIMLIAQLQLASRHPLNRGASAALGRRVIDGLIANMESLGLGACATIARYGDNPEFDTERTPDEH